MAADEPSAPVGVQKVIEEGPIVIGAEDFFADGLKQLHAGASQDALDALSIAIQLDPRQEEAYAYRGMAYYQLGNRDAAMEDYDKSIAVRPNLAQACFFRAGLHGHRKEHDKAVADYTRTIELKPGQIEAYYFRSLNYGSLGRYEEALRDMKTAAEAGYEPAREFLESHRLKPEWN